MSQSAWLVDHLDDAWPEVSRRVLAGLHALGARSDVAEDAVQEAAARLWRAQPDVDSIEGLTRWTLTVARRVIINDACRRLVTCPLSDEAALADTASVESSAMARVEVSRVARAFRSLRVPDQHALLSVVDNEGARVAPVDRKEAVRLAVRLHRARARLAEKVQWVGGIVVVTARRLRSAASLAPAGITPAFGVAVTVTVGLVVLSPWLRVPGGEAVAGGVPRTSAAIDAAAIVAMAPSGAPVAPIDGASAATGAPSSSIAAAPAFVPAAAPPSETPGTRNASVASPLEKDPAGEPPRDEPCTTCVRENIVDTTPSELVGDALPPGSTSSCTCDPGERVPGPGIPLSGLLPAEIENGTETETATPLHQVVREAADSGGEIGDGVVESPFVPDSSPAKLPG